MDTKRCAYCHKLLRADAQVCSLCGKACVQQKTKGKSRSGGQRSIPPASPHRAGHYSGIHPEDRPYQSSMIAVQHPPKRDEEILHVPSYEEDEEDGSVVEPELRVPPSLPDMPTEPVSPTFDEEEEIATLIVQHVQQQVPVHARATPPPLSALPTLPTLKHKKPLLSRRAIPILLSLSCLFFLLASGILVFVLGSRRTIAVAALTANPQVLRTGDSFQLTGQGFGVNNELSFTYDAGKTITTDSGQPLKARTDALGNFAVTIRVLPSWSVGEHILHATDSTENLSVSTRVTVQPPASGPPHLQIVKKTLDLGNGRAGTTAHAPFTLTNQGGGEIDWQESSDVSWLTVTPNKGTFHGSDLISITGNRSGLRPQSYTGQITFAQKDGSTPQVLTVTMTVNPEPAALNISASALSFSSLVTQASPSQTVTLQNNGGESLNWGSSVATSDGSNWLSIFPTQGSIAPASNQVVTVGVVSQALAAGQYQGTINFTGGANAQVTITLSVIAPGNLVVSTPTLNFTTTAGQNPTGQVVTLQNNGGTTVNWSAAATTIDKGTWLSANIMNGSLDPGLSVPITVNINGVSLKTGAYQGILTFSFGGSTRQIAVSCTATAPPMPAISAQTAPLHFSTYRGTNPQPQTFTLTNSGNAPLNWIATTGGAGADTTIVTPTGGQLLPAKSVTITVSPNVVSAIGGTLTSTITISDSDTGVKIPSQQIPVTVDIIDQPSMALDNTALSLSASSGYPNTSTLLTIRNTGTQNLNWAITPDQNAPWLTVDTPSGTVAPGQNVVINVQASSSQLAPGTYTATLTISDTDSGTPVAPQTIRVTFVVS